MAHLGIPFAKYFPLRDVPSNLLNDVCRKLWGWKSCQECSSTGFRPCGRCPSCPWSAMPLLEPFQRFYEQLTYRHTPEDRFKFPPALQSHVDLLNIAAFIQDHPCMPRKELMERYFYRNSPPASMDTNQNQAFDFALSVLSMMPFAENELSLDDRSAGGPETWSEHKSAYEAIEGAIAVGRSLSRDEKRMVSQSLSVAKLRSCGLDILKTDDFRQHLDYDPVIEGMYIFHHHGFLRGHLSSTRASVCPDNRTVFAPELLHETFNTMQHILCEWHDEESSADAARAKIEFGGLHAKTPRLCAVGSADRQYQYWGARLLTLADVVRESTLRRRVRRWCMRHKRKAYVMMLALTLIVAIVSVAVGSWLQGLEKPEQCSVVLMLNGTSSDISVGT